MSRFDQRAEATSRNQRREDRDRSDRRRAPSGGGGPSRAEIRAVRKALGSRNRGIEDATFSIDTFMRLERGDPNEGPVTPPVGTDLYVTIVRQFTKVAAEIRKVSEAVNAVDFDAADKRAIRSALAESAKSWEARAEMVGAADPAIAEAAADAARAHDDKAFSLGKPVLAYFADRND